MTETSTIKTLADGRIFPHYRGETLSWSIGLYFTHAESQSDYPRTRAVLAAMREHRPEQLERERREMLKASFDRMFGHNAAKVLALIDEETETAICDVCGQRHTPPAC